MGAPHVKVRAGSKTETKGAETAGTNGRGINSTGQKEREIAIDGA